MAKEILTETETTVKPPATMGPWTATQGSCDGHLAEWWDVMGAPEPYPEGTSVFARGVCMVYSHEGAAEANARLIASSPRLLDALRGMVGLIQLIDSREPDLKNNHRFLEAVAAIEAAEGRQS